MIPKWTLPLQSVTSAEPSFSVNVPFVHFKQVLFDLSNGWYSPIAHMAQGTTPVFEYVPGWQMS